jgi:hypothetical protein
MSSTLTFRKALDNLAGGLLRGRQVQLNKDELIEGIRQPVRWKANGGSGQEHSEG